MGGRTGQAAAGRGLVSTVLGEVTSETLDAKHIRRRVNDWEERVEGLYAMIGGWLPDGWEARRGPPVLMHEKLMRKFGVEAKRIPTLELHGNAGQVVRLEPHALWIIGMLQPNIPIAAPPMAQMISAKLTRSEISCKCSIPASCQPAWQSSAFSNNPRGGRSPDNLDRPEYRECLRTGTEPSPQCPASLRQRTERVQGASTILGAAARPARISAKARAPSESGRISAQSSVPRRPAKSASAVSRKSAAL